MLTTSGARRHSSEATCWHTRAEARHQPRRRKVLFHSPPGIFDPTEHAVRRLGSEASAVGVDRGQWDLTDRGDEGVVVPGERNVARHPEAADIAPTAARSSTAAVAVTSRP